ncbi:MAG: hypothetical protein M2R45_01308 [Verrucomicrobia subdivision 3 bacterium]|nr:hypothetical protein [Limisphaerales bacterium]MCS1415174.1 hypothetical protein [Limisphaerales bacterium]
MINGLGSRGVGNFPSTVPSEEGQPVVVEVMDLRIGFEDKGFLVWSHVCRNDMGEWCWPSRDRSSASTTCIVLMAGVLVFDSVFHWV